MISDPTLNWYSELSLVTLQWLLVLGLVGLVVLLTKTIRSLL